MIPSLRGPYRSVPVENLTEEARTLAEQGVRELILVAQDTACYGKDLYGEKRLHVLLRELCGIDGIQWIRILYCYPEEIYPELVEIMKQEPKICHYLDMPIQHSEDDILRRMGRRTRRESLLSTIGMLRREIPDIVLRTTLITGFPGETEEQHHALLDFLDEEQIYKQRFSKYGIGYTQSLLEQSNRLAASLKARREEERLEAQEAAGAARRNLHKRRNWLGESPVMQEGA